MLCGVIMEDSRVSEAMQAMLSPCHDCAVSSYLMNSAGSAQLGATSFHQVPGEGEVAKSSEHKTAEAEAGTDGHGICACRLRSKHSHSRVTVPHLVGDLQAKQRGCR